MGMSFKYFNDWLALLFFATLALPAQARMTIDDSVLAGSYSPISFVSPLNIGHSMIAEPEKSRLISHFCGSVEKYFAKYNWEKKPCGNVKWKADLKTKNGHPLIYAEFGEGKETTLLLGGVHPDEMTPIPITFKFADHLQKHPELYKNQGMRVIIAPLVNPDGFLRSIPTRNNANGVDPNRNFYTMDWYSSSKNHWVDRRKSVIRHFPGYFPNTEIETLFQSQLMDNYHPDKILSIHAPLGFLDYDGPGDQVPQPKDKDHIRAKGYVYSISEKSRDYRVVDFRFYPGSLGNYAGNERFIPTVTLELETTNPKKIDDHWRQFLPGILQSIHYPFTKPGLIIKQDSTQLNATRFSIYYVGPENETI
jgi:protein MpaA